MFARPLRTGITSVLVCSTLIAGLFTQAPLAAAPPTAEQKRIDDAIVRALKFLAAEQQPSGAWAIDAFGESTAATSLAIMAFMAAGHVPGEGPYGDLMDKGLRWVLDHQQQNGLLVHKTSHGPMYCHGISTLMLAEAVGMLDEEQAQPSRKALERAIKLILDAQNHAKSNREAGGWRYNPTSRDSDLSVTGWQLLSLRAAKNVGCDVPADNIDRAVEYVKNCSVRGNRGFAYQPGSGASPTRTGTGILCLEICGKHHADETLGGADYLIQNPLQYHDHYFFYGVYYCTVGMFQVGGDRWETFKGRLNQVLLDNQSPDGSWLPPGGERRMGRTYATSMAVLALAVEYQYLPIYQR